MDGKLLPLTLTMQKEYTPTHILSGARVRRLERRHTPKAFTHQAYLQAVLDFAKELPEDGELDLSDIPGIATALRTSFSFVEDEVRVHLTNLPAAQIDEVVQRLRVFEGDVFETLTQPRPPPVREFDVPIVEKPGLSPPARRPYPVAPHHQPELDRQIKALLAAGIIRRTFSPYSAPVLFTPKKDGTKYEFVSAPFGLTSVLGAFQCFMQFVLADHIAAGYCVVYCDEIAIFSMSDDPMVHLQHVEAVLTSLRAHQLLAKGSKCEFMRREAEFLGFMVSGEGVRPAAVED